MSQPVVRQLAVGVAIRLHDRVVLQTAFGHLERGPAVFERGPLPADHLPVGEVHQRPQGQSLVVEDGRGAEVAGALALRDLDGDLDPRAVVAVGQAEFAADVGMAQGELGGEGFEARADHGRGGGDLLDPRHLFRGGIDPGHGRVVVEVVVELHAD